MAYFDIYQNCIFHLKFFDFIKIKLHIFLQLKKIYIYFKIILKKCIWKEKEKMHLYTCFRWNTFYDNITIIMYLFYQHVQILLVLLFYLLLIYDINRCVLLKYEKEIDWIFY